MKRQQAPVLLQDDIAGFSWPVSIQGKVRLAANGRRPLQCGQTHPSGVPVIPCDSVAALDKGVTIASARRLVAEHDSNAEPVNITWSEY